MNVPDTNSDPNSSISCTQVVQDSTLGHMTSPILFIDFDGVLNRGSGRFEPDFVDRLNRITDQTGASLVIHSSWRWARTVTQLTYILREAGVTGLILDKCPCPIFHVEDRSGFQVEISDWDNFKGTIATDDERAIAIQRWLDENPTVTNFAILDDCNALGHFVGTPHFIRTNMTQGLTDENAAHVIRVLESQSAADRRSQDSDNGSQGISTD